MGDDAEKFPEAEKSLSAEMVEAAAETMAATARENMAEEADTKIDGEA